MRRIKRSLIYSSLCLLALGCTSRSRTLPEFPSAPSREAFEGFRWETVEGKELMFWAQRNEVIHVMVDDAKAEAGIVDDGDREAFFLTVIKVFPLPSGEIEELLSVLRQTPEWDPTVSCGFRQVRSSREGVTRYVLEPTGASAEKIQELSTEEPIPSTCGGWGVGNSGMRYFKIHDSHPKQVLFVEIGQDAPLFDEQSIVLK